MAWSAPSTFTVNQIVTAAIMNSDVRDNMKYLKGQSGSVAIEDDFIITDSSMPQLALANSGGGFKMYLGSLSARAAAIDINRNNGTGTFDDGAYSHARIKLDGNGSTSFITLETAAANNTTASERLRVDGSGNVGIGVTVPQGRIHTYNTISGCLKFEADAVAGTLVPIIPDGAGDVLYGIMGLYAVRSNTGVTRGGTFSGAATTLLTPSSNVDLFNVAGDVLQLQVAANGSVGVIRTGAATPLTYKVSLWLMWL